jgi:hypothetical protein
MRVKGIKQFSPLLFHIRVMVRTDLNPVFDRHQGDVLLAGLPLSLLAFKVECKLYSRNVG